MALGTGFRPQHELVMQFVKGVGKYYAKDGRNVIDCPRQNVNTRLHQTQKPTELLKHMIRVTTPEGGVVVDPFAGSGSTVVSAVELARHSLGFELSENYVEIANKRIVAPDLFQTPDEPGDLDPDEGLPEGALASEYRYSDDAQIPEKLAEIEAERVREVVQ